MSCRCSETQQKSKAETAREEVIEKALELVRAGVRREDLTIYTELIKALNTW